MNESLDLGNHRLSVLIAEHDYGFALWQSRLQKLHAIAKRACVARIWMKNVFRPMFRWTRVVTEWPNDFAFERPLTGNQKIRKPFGARISESIRIALAHMLKRATNSLRLAIWSNAKLKCSERDTATVDGVQTFSESIHHRLERAIHA